MLQSVYLRFRDDEDFADFAYQYGFELSLADTIASGKMIELATGGVQVIENAYADMIEMIKTHPNSTAMLGKLSR